ncbi:hypothetical protein [Lysobacter sp. BMK333-48F3]|nr:hypothetical protein [Lysobacter sp. BMK333-48F3]
MTFPSAIADRRSATRAGSACAAVANVRANNNNRNNASLPRAGD